MRHKTDVSPPTQMVEMIVHNYVSSTSFMYNSNKKNKDSQVRYCITILHRQWDFIHKLFTPIEQNIFCYFFFFVLVYVQGVNATDQPSIDTSWSVWKKEEHRGEYDCKKMPIITSLFWQVGSDHFNSFDTVSLISIIS